MIAPVLVAEDQVEPFVKRRSDQALDFA